MIIRGVPFLCLFLFIISNLFSCAPQKAIIDRTAQEKIFWPGPPEKPRIKYLWSISTVSGAERSGIYDFFAGGPETDLTDPRASYRLLRPYSVFVDERSVLYIADPGAYRITIIDIESGASREIINAGKEEFLSPIGIVAHGGKIYVSDSVLKKVFIFNGDGELAGKFDGGFERPTSLALDRNRGIIYVSDTLAHKIYIYSTDGRRQGSIGKNGSGEGELNFPTHLWVDGEGRLYVTDSMNFRIQIFSPNGMFVDMFGILGDAYGHLDKPKGVATDSEGNIYVIDSIKDTVKIFNREGMLLLFFGQQGQNYGQFWLPSGIFIDKDNRIYVSDTYNGRVQVFQYQGSK